MKRFFLTITLFITIHNLSFSNNLESGLVAYYPFNGNANDESGNGNHGTIIGAALTTDRFGNANKAYSFNRNYIEIPNSQSLQSPNASITISFWTYITQWDMSSAAFISKSNTSSLGQYGAMATSSPYVQTDLGGQYVRFTKTLSLNTWLLICLKWDGQKVKYYRNGTLVDSVNFSGTISADNYPLNLGRHTPGTTTYLRGKLDEVRIYNRSLTDAEILMLYNESNFTLKMIPQGFYNISNSKLRMRDTVRIYVRQAFSPYQILDSAKAVIDSVTFTGNFKTFVPSTSYYISVKHRNSLETWSSSLLYIEDNASYDFTTSISQAYGNNLALNGGKYCLYGGDINSDGTIDATDLSIINNSAFNFALGYDKSDLTGDNVVDGSDYIIADNNAFNFVIVIAPNSNTAQCNLTANRFFSWKGFTWWVIGTNETKCYPGPNYYSSSTDNVYVDSSGDLHLKITKRNNKFYCAELFTAQTFGYGTYTFYLSTRVDSLDKNTVLGLFTWNDKNCVTNANSEIDIEFARWGDASNTYLIDYSVQPTNGGIETDRFATREIQLNSKYSQHTFDWTPSLVTFSSYREHVYPPSPGNLISSWSYSNANTPKSKFECNSNPIVIPSPESNTHLNLNLWLDRGNYPSNNQEVEIVIHNITFTQYDFGFKISDKNIYIPQSLNLLKGN